MGFASVRTLLVLGAVSGILIGLVPVGWLYLNKVIRFLATFGTRYPSFSDPTWSSFAVPVPDILMLAVFGAALAYFRMLSVQRNRFYMMGTDRGLMRVGLDDLIALLIGTPLIWFMFYRHGYGRLFFITGAQHLLFPFLGFILGSIWQSIYARLVARLARVPLHTEIPAVVRRSLDINARIEELFRAESVVWNPATSTLTISGSGSDRFRSEKGEEQLRNLIRNIPVVTQNVATITVVDTSSS